jgi:hypothetical protein
MSGGALSEIPCFIIRLKKFLIIRHMVLKCPPYIFNFIFQPNWNKKAVT